MTYQAPTTSLRPKSRPTTVDSSPRPPSRSSQPSSSSGSGGLASPTTPKNQEEKPSMVDRFWSLFDSTGGTVSEDDTTSSSERALSFYDSVDMTLPEVTQVSPTSELAPATTDPYVGAVGTGNRDVAPNTMDSYLQGDAGIEAIMPPASGLMRSPTQEDTDAAVSEAMGKNTGLMGRPLTDDDMGLPSDAGFTATDAQKALGFTGGAVDGDFGPNSRKKLLDFQRRAGLPLTGDFNDPATRAALTDPESTDPRKVVPIDTSPDLTTSGNIDMNKVTEYLKSTIQNPLKAAGIIGTIRQEIGNGPIRTEGMGYRLGKKATATSDATGAYAIFRDSDVDAALANLSTTEQARAKTNVPMNALGQAIMDIKYDGGHAYRGRGLVQITHKDMYKQVGDKIGVDLVANPELVNDPEYAVPAAIALLEIKDYFGKATTKNNLRSMINPGQTDAKRDARWKYVEAAHDEIRAN